jgi:hypothetical protein
MRTKIASRISNARRAADGSSRRAVDSRRASDARAQRRLGRKARRWLDLLAVHTTNGVPRNRWPGERLLTLDESFAISLEAFARLKRVNPVLSVEVARVQDARDKARDVLPFEARRLAGLQDSHRSERMRRAIRRRRIAAGCTDVY